MNYFLTLEGVEGAGKSTVKKFFQTFFQKYQLPYRLTREPGGTEIAEQIRKLLLTNHQEKMADTTELLLYFASRAQHLDQVIKPALAQGINVISDRFTEATFAYQCGGRGIPYEKVAILERFVQQDLRPDQVFLLDLPVSEGLRRIQERRQLDRLEIETVEFFDRVRTEYLNLANKFPERFCIVDASLPLAEIEQLIFEKLRILYKL